MMDTTHVTAEPTRQRLAARLSAAFSAWRDTIRLAGGIPMARRLNPVGFRWLKSNYLSTGALLSTWPRRFSDRDFELFFAALVIQKNPGMSDDEALAAVRGTRRTRIYLALLLRGGLGHDFEESAR